MNEKIFPALDEAHKEQLNQAMKPISAYIEETLFDHVVNTSISRKGLAIIQASRILFTFGFTKIGIIHVPTVNNIQIGKDLERIGQEGVGIVKTFEEAFSDYKYVAANPVTYSPFWIGMDYRQQRGSNFYLKIQGFTT